MLFRVCLATTENFSKCEIELWTRNKTFSWVLGWNRNPNETQHCKFTDSEQGRQTIPQSQGRPLFVIEKEFLEDLRSCDSYTWTDIARILGISRWTLYSSVREFKLENLSKYSDFSGDELDALIRRHISQQEVQRGNPIWLFQRVERD